MPQMMPINWLMSFFYFNLVFMMFIIMNYYIFVNNHNINNNISIKKINTSHFNWKW